MNKKIYTLDEIVSTLKPVFFSNGVHKAILFGSYSKGIPTASSDIDIFVDSGLKGLSFYGLLEDVTEALKIDVDLIDSSQVIPNSNVDKEIKKSGVLIYER